MKALLIATVCLAVLLPPAALAQGQQINVFTFEDASCAAWAKSGGNKLLRAQYEFWVRGFVSGHNFANPSRQVKVGAFPGSEGLYQYLDQYCRDNPTLSFVGGAIQLVEQLREPAAGKSATSKSTPAKKTPPPAPAVK